MRLRNLLGSYWLGLVFCVLVIPATGLGLGLLAALVYSPGSLKQGYHHAQWEQQRPKHANTYSEEPPALLGLITGWNLQSYARYCAHQPANDVDRWAKDYRCAVKSTDVYAAFASLVVMFLTLGLMIVGILQYVVYRRQAKIMKLQATIMSRQTDLTIGVQRALMVNLGAKSTVGKDSNSGEVIWGFAVSWQNKGPTIALGCRALTIVSLVDRVEGVDSFPPSFPSDIGNAESFPVPPDGQIRGAWQPIRHSDLEAVFDRKKSAFLYSRVEYDDLFELTKRRHSEVCLEIQLVASPNLPSDKYFDYRVRGLQNSML